MLIGHFRQRKRKILIFVCLCLFSSLAFLFYPETKIVRDRKKTFSRSLIMNRLLRRTFFQSDLILFYTDFYGTRPWHRVFLREHLQCKQSIPCELSYDKDRFVSSRAVVFHAPDNPNIEELSMLYSHPIRSRQVWIYFTMESALNTNYNPQILPMFNWTMSYRRKSDFRFSYGYYYPKQKVDFTDPTDYLINYAENKTGQIAWLVSNCGQKRESLVKKLTKVLKVHVGGKCKNVYKNRIERCEGRVCSETLKKYKFYLAFENSFCPDYVTEKYWLHALHNNMIPIVLGGANYKDPRFAIPGSYIDVFDFKNPKQLIEYIQKVDSNDALFNSYFQWKRKFRFSSEVFECHPAIREICSTLNGSKNVDVVVGGKKGHRNTSVIFDDKHDCYAREWLYKMWLRA